MFPLNVYHSHIVYYIYLVIGVPILQGTRNQVFMGNKRGNINFINLNYLLLEFLNR